MEDVSVQQPAGGDEELRLKLKAQEEELAKLRQLNELLLERMNKKDKKAVLGSASGSEGENGEKQYESFEVKKVPVRHEATGEVIDFDHIVTVKDAQLLAYVKNFAVCSATKCLHSSNSLTDECEFAARRFPVFRPAHSQGR